MALAVLSQERAPAANSHLDWHASEALLWVEIPDVPALLAAYERAPAVAWARDETIRASTTTILDELDLRPTETVAEALRSIGVPAEVAGDPLARLLEGSRSLQAVSVSLAVAEGTRGELAPCVAQVIEAAREVRELTALLEGFAAAHDERYPQSLEPLELEDALRDDPWGHAYVYEASPELDSASVRSLGGDAAPGGSGPAADIDVSFDAPSWVQAELRSRVALCAVIEFTDARAADAALATLSALTEPSADGEAGQPLELRGVKASLRRFKLPRQPELAGWSLSSGELVVLGLGATRVEDVLARSAGRADTLATAPALARLAENLSTASGATVVRLFWDGTTVRDSVTAALASAGAESTQLRALNSIAGSFALRMQLDGERFFTDVVSLRDAAAPTWLDAFGSAPVSSELARSVPKDAIAVYETTLDGGALHEQFFSLIGIAGQPEHAAHAELADLEARHGFELKRDVFDAVGPGCVAYMLPITSVASLPGAALVIELRDPAAFERGVRGLVAAMQEPPTGDVQVKFKEYRDVPMWTFSFEAAQAQGMNPFAISPTIAIVNGRAIVTLNSVRATKEIKRAQGEAEEPHVLLARPKPPPATATSIGYMDWGSLFGGVYTAGRGALTLLGGNASVPFDVNKISAALPEANALTRFFQPTLIWSRPIDGGSYTRCESSFGPETWLGLLGTLALIGVRSQTNAATAPDEPEVQATDPTASDATRTTLDYLATRLAVFQLDQGRLPRSLDELAQPTTNYPNGFLDAPSVPHDAWEHVFGYTVAADGAGYRLWSFGPDGVDQDGAGDDLVAP